MRLSWVPSPQSPGSPAPVRSNFAPREKEFFFLPARIALEERLAHSSCVVYYLLSITQEIIMRKLIYVALIAAGLYYAVPVKFVIVLGIIAIANWLFDTVIGGVKNKDVLRNELRASYARVVN